jgi:hypothetical protein
MDPVQRGGASAIAEVPPFSLRGAEGIRTPDPLTASQVLCQAELQPRSEAKVYQESTSEVIGVKAICGASAQRRSRS